MPWALLASALGHIALAAALSLLISHLGQAPRVAVDFEWKGPTSTTGAAAAPRKPTVRAKSKRASPSPKKHSFSLNQEVSAEEALEDNAPTDDSAPVGEGSVVSTARVTTLPRRVRDIKANYPPEARKLGLQGRVILALLINAEGDVAEARVVEGAGHGFDEEALKAVKQFKFAPAYLGDKPVAVEVRYTYVFELR